MSEEQIQHTSIILETVSFFLVTIDLYGKERLTDLRNRIIKNDIEQIKKGKYFRKITIILASTILISAELFIKGSIRLSIVREGFFNFILQNWKTFAVILLFSILLLTNETKVKNFIKNKILGGIVSIPISMFKIFPIEGIMITLGTIIFLISKIMIF